MKDGKDVLLTTAADKAAFVPQIDVAHQMYNNIWPPKHPDWMSSSYLENKRNNARILRDKGIANYRMYEVRGTSHSGGESMPDSMQRGDLQNIDVSKVMDRFIDMLDAWVDKGNDAAADALGRSRARRRTDGAPAPALALPEIACPLGVYYNYPETVSGATAFAAVHRQGHRAAQRQERLGRHEPQRRLGLPRNADAGVAPHRPAATDGNAHAREVRRLRAVRGRRAPQGRVLLGQERSSRTSRARRPPT